MAQGKGNTIGGSPGLSAWVRGHLGAVAGASGVVVIVVVILVAVTVGGSGSSGPVVAPGSIVGTEPLTSGYRLTGKIVKNSVASITVRITSLDASGGEARNVVLRPGKEIEFDRPADGTMALARNGHEITSPLQLHTGDTIVLVGQFTSVVTPPAPAHQGYSFIGVEASSK